MPKRGAFLFLVVSWKVSLHFLGMFIEPFNQIHLYFVKSASLCSSWFFCAMIMSKTRTCWKNFQLHFHRISQGIVWLKWKSGLDRNCHAKRSWTIYIISNKFWLRYNKGFLNHKLNSWNLVLLSAIFSFYQIWIMSLTTNKHFFGLRPEPFAPYRILWNKSRGLPRSCFFHTNLSAQIGKSTAMIASKSDPPEGWTFLA